MSESINSLNFNQPLQYSSGFPAHVIQPYKIGKAYEDARDKQFQNAIGDRVKTGCNVKWMGIEVKYTEHQTTTQMETEIELDTGGGEEGGNDEEEEGSPREGSWQSEQIQRTQHVFESTEMWRSVLVTANTVNKRNTLLKINTNNQQKFQDQLQPGSIEGSLGSSLSDGHFQQRDSQTFRWRIEASVSKIFVYIMFSQRSHFIGGFEMILHGGEKISTFMNRIPPDDEIFQIHEIDIASQAAVTSSLDPETSHSTPCILVGIETAVQKKKDGFHAIEFGFVSQEDRKSTRLNSSHEIPPRMPSSA
eukprot:TRINITY_DN15050_c0_g1_i1.p1 TRINITY_DN15050_c0_g1~~TRINITY_DN15050_c0_g1_i1.p1  ORF type:complete len:305 (-),score=45.75 TRINITY_DN15050_c0_g1_i1:41-955(-)